MKSIKYRFGELLAGTSFSVVVCIIIGTVMFDLTLLPCLVLGCIGSICLSIVEGCLRIEDKPQKDESTYEKSYDSTLLLDHFDDMFKDETCWDHDGVDEFKGDNLTDISHAIINDDLDKEIIENLGTGRK